MSYTDSQMIVASQIAYWDFDIDILDDRPYTINELIELELDSSDATHVEKALEIQELIQKREETEVCGEWVIQDICNDQHGSGMYACMIDTRDDEALIAFRGSESDTLENVIKDWGFSDIGLLNSILTPQQAAAEKYTSELYKKYGSRYTSFSMTGHSLGGNLAEHATITAADGVRDKINQCVNLDGPGFSKKYLKAHAGDIEKSKGIVKHYQWSIVGSLLTAVPGSYYQTVEAKTPQKDGWLSSMAWRHETVNVIYDDDGNFIAGERDALAQAAAPLAQAIDFSLFAFMGTPVITTLYNTFDQLRDGLQKLWEQWEEARSAARDASFEVNSNILSNEAGQLIEYSSRLQNISSEIERIQKQLAFSSISSSYVKIKLWSIAGTIESDGKKIKRYGEIGNECENCYRSSEMNIAGYY